MSKVRVLVGTKKGAFVLTADGKRKSWDVSGPHFAGWELYHLSEDWSELHDLAADDPVRVKELATRWWELAEEYNVLPLDDRLIERFSLPAPPGSPQALTELTFRPGTRRVGDAERRLAQDVWRSRGDRHW